VALTLDYETWQPVPPDRTISWTDDVLDPTSRLLDVCDETGAKLTIMAEVGEYLWLLQNDPSVATMIERQLREALERDHDVQLHLHLAWLPELGASFEAGRFAWPQDYLRPADYAGDLVDLIARCRRALEEPLRDVRRDYRVTCFRAGAYQVQPFRRLHDALVRNGIECDTSVYAGGVSRERGYDFSLAYTEHQPYFASPWDAQLRAPADEGRLVELPVFTYARGQRWLLDGDQGPLLAHRFLESDHTRAPRGDGATRPSAWLARAAELLWGGHSEARGAQRINRLVPRALAHRMVAAPGPPRLAHDFFVLIGHSKGDLRFPGIRASLAQLREEAGVRFVTLAEMARQARADLDRCETVAAAAPSRGALRLTGAAVLERGLDAQLRELLPWDCDRVLRIPGVPQAVPPHRAALPWYRQATLVLDGETSTAPGPWTVAGTLPSLPWRDDSFDLIVVTGALERQRAVDRSIAELHRVLRTGGALVAAIASEARGPERALPQHDWKTAPHDIELRLAAAGFVDTELRERDGYRELGLPPFPPADDRFCLLRARKRAAPASQLERARQIMAWVYGRLSPERSQTSNDVIEILRDGFAWCGGYNNVVARLLQREGVRVTWVTMEAEGHPRGRGPHHVDTHEVLEAILDGRACVLDAMTNRCQLHSLLELLAKPQLATPRDATDARYRDRGYQLYDTSFWYERVMRYCLRDEPERDPCTWRSVAGRAAPACQGLAAT
jgi:hypothetical protein